MTTRHPIRNTTGRIGTGNWAAFDINLDRVFQAAQKWKRTVNGYDKLWLCWNVSDSWCVLQQKLILELGWTPIVGWDPLWVNPPPILTGSILVNFNEDLRLVHMHPNFPLEFAFLWCDKLAFWHSDLFVRMNKLEKIATLFEKVRDGAMAAVLDIGGLRNVWRFRLHRYWELLGCTTKGASEHQFQAGCGWWRSIQDHPNCPDNEKRIRKKYNSDHGGGIMYWKRKYKGKVYNISARWISEGHCSSVNNKNYVRLGNRPGELALNFELEDVARKLKLEKFL